jgi:tetratricopeptide (TPR) repeat protein
MTHRTLFPGLLLATFLLGVSTRTLAAEATADTEDTTTWNADRWMAEGWKRKAVDDFTGALEAFRAALAAGAGEQVIAMEMGYIHTHLGRIEAARAQFKTAAEGPNDKLKEQAELELANLGRSSQAVGTVAHAAMTRAYALCDTEDWADAVEALEEARAAGWDAQAIDLQLGYVEVRRNNLDAARAAFQAASKGSDEGMADQAAGALAALPPGISELTESDRKLADGRRLRDGRRWNEAIVAFKKAEADGADAQQVHYELGRIALILRDISPRRQAAEIAAREAVKAARRAAMLKAEAERLAAELEAEAEEGEDAKVEVPEAPELTEEELAAITKAGIRETQRREFAQRFLNQAYQMKRSGDMDGAISAFRFAADAGADGQGIAMEIGFVELERGNKGTARRQFVAGVDGPNQAATALASNQLRYLPSDDPAEWTGDHWMIEAYRLKLEDDMDGAAAAFVAAAENEADERLVALELAVISWGKPDLEEAQKHYLDAVRGEEADDYEIRGRRGLATTDPQTRDEWGGNHWIAEAHFLAGVGDYEGAVNALNLGKGASDANVGLIVEYRETLEDAREWTKIARHHLSEARTGGDAEIADAAQRRLDKLPPDGRGSWPSGVWLANARFLRTLGDLDGAEEAYEKAREEGADSQIVDLELGYLELSRGRIRLARKHLRDAKKGENEKWAEMAGSQLKVMPRLFHGDLYAEVFGYSRLVPQRFDNVIGFLRVRGFVRPVPFLDLQPYVFLQISRDVSSRGIATPSDVPLILNDNALLLGGGLLFRFWEQKAGVYVQIAAAFKLIRDGRKPIDWDLRIGAFVAPSIPMCNPAPEPGGVRPELLACAEFYGDVTYVSRFDHNVFFFARGRFGATWLVTGPVAWQPLVEGRFVKDIRNDYWNNFVDVGLMHRWRLLTPIGLDLMVGVHSGRHLGLAHVEPDGSIPNPVPNPPGFLDLRVLLATYLIF